MSGSKESQLDILALAYEHYRLLRDSAHRADDYLERIVKRGGSVLMEEFWLDLPEPTTTISLKELKDATVALLGEFTIKMTDIKEQADKIVKELNLTKSVDTILYDLMQSQRKDKKSVPKDLEEWDHRHEQDEISQLDALTELPTLKPNQKYEWQKSPEKVWKIVELLENSPEPKGKIPFSLKRRPRQ